MRSPLLLALAPFALLVACNAELSNGEGDLGDRGETTSHVTRGCSASREELLAAAGGARAQAIARGFEWLDADVPYSQSAQHEGYRTDCSGFVSMCWQLPQSYTTANFAAGTGGNTLLDSYEDLQPGDGLVRRSSGAGHAVLFVGWDDDAHTEACVLEQASSASDMQFGVRTVSSLEGSGFKAMRADDMPDAAPTAAEEEAPPVDTDPVVEPPVPQPPIEEAPPVDADPPREGDPCGDDETCNPGLSGTGLVCGGTGTCVKGCKFDLDCPGTLLCRRLKCQ